MRLSISHLTSYRYSSEVSEELDAVAARSVRHADFQPTYGWVAAFNTFAFAYSRAGNYRSAVPYLLVFKTKK